MKRRALLVGTFDPDFARNRTICRLLERNGWDVIVHHVPVWRGKRYEVLAEPKVPLALRLLKAQWAIAFRLLRTPPPEIVIGCYPGYFDVPILRLWTWLWRRPLIFDMFISLYDTFVDDRGLTGARSSWGRLVRSIDRMSCRLPDIVTVDTREHGNYFEQEFGLRGSRVFVLPIGAQEAVFRPQPDIVPVPGLVVFHGTFIGLQGLETIVRAAKLLEPDGIRVRLLGAGQEQAKVDQLLAELAPANVELTGFVSLEQVVQEVAAASLCLGVFGTSSKAARVVPNKLYECLAVGRPVLTRESAAIREAFGEEEVATCAAGDPEALAASIRQLLASPERLEAIGRAGHNRYLRDYSEAALAQRLNEVLSATTT